MSVIECHCCQRSAESTVNGTSLTVLKMTGIGTAYCLRGFLFLHRKSTQFLVLMYMYDNCAYARKAPHQ
jgi:hypothetical protein